MFQYGYSNFEHKGYRIASQNDFFRDRERETQLRKLVGHIAASGDSTVSFLGITTDLDLPEEKQRFFFQMSGREEYRSADYAHGIVQDLNQNDFPFFEEGFLTVLRAHFMSGEELGAISAGESDSWFHDISSPCTEGELKPAELEERLLAQILDDLMCRKKVILKLDRSGEEAVKRSREVLLRIYECLPYGVRKYAGFCTNVAPARFTGEDGEGKLPDAVRLCLVDGDEKLPRSVPGYRLYDMNEGAKKRYETDEFLCFLMQEQGREAYFKMVSESCEKSQKEQISKELYRNAFLMHTLASREVSREAMSEWVQWYKNASSAAGKELRKEFAQILSMKLDSQDMLRFAREETDDLAAMLLLFQEICERDAENRESTMQKLGENLAEIQLKEIWKKVDEKRIGGGTKNVPCEQALKLFGELKTQAVSKARERGSSEIARLAKQYLVDRLEAQEQLLRKEYEEEKKREQEHFGNRILELESAEQITFRELKALFEEAQREDTYPLCALEMKDKAINEAYTQECAERLSCLFKKRPFPKKQDELSAFVEDWKDANAGDFFLQSLWNENRRKEVQNFVNSAEVYLERSSDESLTGQLELLGELWSKTKYGCLGESLLKQAREMCCGNILKKRHEEYELLDNLTNCCTLAKYERECIEMLCKPLWNVDVLEINRCWELLTRHDEWEALGAALHHKVTIQKDEKVIGAFQVREAVNQILQMTDKRYQLLQQHREKLAELTSQIERKDGIFERMKNHAAGLEQKEVALLEQQRNTEKLIKGFGWILCALPGTALAGIIFIFLLSGIRF